MKRIWIFLLTAILLVSCGTSGGIGESTTDTGGMAEPVFEGDRLPLLTAANGFYSDGRLYYTDQSFVRCTNLETRDDRVLCYDPLCTHDNEVIYTDCECPAYRAVDGFTGRVLADGDKIWFLAEEPASDLPGDFTTYYQIRCIDLSDMSLDVYLRTNEISIYDFWIYGGEMYLSMPTEKTDENGSLYCTGGSIYRMEKSGRLNLVLEDTDSVQYQLIGSGEGCVYYTAKFGQGEIYRATSDFSYTEMAAVLSSTFNVKISGEYVYYMKKTGNSYRLDGEHVEGDFDSSVSYTAHAGNEYGLYRMKLSDPVEETVYPSMPHIQSNVVINRCAYYIDETAERIWLTPLDPVYDGYGIWQMDMVMMQMGASGKDVLTMVFSETSGRLLSLDLNTLEITGEYTISDWDVRDIFAVENGRIMGLFRLTDSEKLKMLHETKGLNSRWEYEEYGIFELE